MKDTREKGDSSVKERVCVCEGYAFLQSKKKKSHTFTLFLIALFFPSLKCSVLYAFSQVNIAFTIITNVLIYMY